MTERRSGDASEPSEGAGKAKPRQTDPAIGLCSDCRHVRPVETKRGSVFFRCGLADTDPSFPRYPPLPVRSCRGYTPRV